MDATQRHPPGLGLAAALLAALGAGGIAAALVGTVLSTGADQGHEDEALQFGDALLRASRGSAPAASARTTLHRNRSAT